MTRIPFTDSITILPALFGPGGDAVEIQTDDVGFGPEIKTVPVVWERDRIRLEYLEGHFMVRRLTPDELKQIELILCEQPF